MKTATRRTLLLAGLLLGLPATAGEPIALFNGKNLDGWHAYLSQHGVSRDEVWSVQDGILVCRGRPIGYLYTDRAFQDFRLVVEWRWAPGAKPSNSGILLRIQDPPKPLPRCLEAQLQHGNAGDAYGFHGMEIDGDPARKIDVQGGDFTGHILGVKKMKPAEKPAGEWNRHEIELKGDRLTIRLNGELVNEATGCTVASGPIGLQSEGGPVQFRKVEITP
ncbi:MAG: DUF1080 domain-containing protein, partial [Verrucomicrobia bacterium]